MRTLVCVLILGLIGSVAEASPEADRRRERVYRALTVIDELGLDEATSGRLFPVLSRYEQTRQRLLGDYDKLVERIGKATEPGATDRLLDQSLANQRALIAIEAKLVLDLRRILPADKAARARVMLLATVPSPTPVADPLAEQGSTYQASTSGPAPSQAPIAVASSTREDLFPPGSALVPLCDPFAQMHRCPDYQRTMRSR